MTVSKRRSFYEELKTASEFKGLADSTVRKFVTTHCSAALEDYLKGEWDLYTALEFVRSRRRILVGRRPRVDPREANPGICAAPMAKSPTEEGINRRTVKVPGSPPIRVAIQVPKGYVPPENSFLDLLSRLTFEIREIEE